MDRFDARHSCESRQVLELNSYRGTVVRILVLLEHSPTRCLDAGEHGGLLALDLGAESRPLGLRQRLAGRLLPDRLARELDDDARRAVTRQRSRFEQAVLAERLEIDVRETRGSWKASLVRDRRLRPHGQTHCQDQADHYD